MCKKETQCCTLDKGDHKNLMFSRVTVDINIQHVAVVLGSVKRSAIEISHINITIETAEAERSFAI